MKSIKPGRGPSKLSAVSSIFVAVFGIFWCIVAGSMGAWFMIPFGLIFTGIAVYQAVYHHHNATSENRYSVADIVDSEEEPDLLNERFGKDSGGESPSDADTFCGEGMKYCPYCGKTLEKGFRYCPKCGKKLPE